MEISEVEPEKKIVISKVDFVCDMIDDSIPKPFFQNYNHFLDIYHHYKQKQMHHIGLLIIVLNGYKQYVKVNYHHLHIILKNIMIEIINRGN